MPPAADVELFAGRRHVAPCSRLVGEVLVPGDKSISHRALILSALSRGTQRISGLSRGADVAATAAALRALGVAISGGEVVQVGPIPDGGLQEPAQPLDCGNSGTSMRLLAGLLAAQPIAATLIGDESLSRRPMLRVVEPLRAMGARIEGRDGGRLAPLVIRGGDLHGIEHHSAVASAQVKTSLLLAGLFAQGRTVIHEPHLSRDHSERMLAACGVALERFDGGVAIEGCQEVRAPEGIAVPGDLSAAAFFLVAAAMLPGSELHIRGLGVNPTRTGLLDVLVAAGVRLDLAGERQEAGEPVADLCVRGGEVQAFEVGGALVPRLIDELPVLAVLAARAHGTSRISGAAELRAKESDRIESTAAMLRLLGVAVETHADGMLIEGSGGRPLAGGAVVAAAGDHRIAMSAAVAATVADGPIEVVGSDAVGTSFPGFFQQLERCSES
jgi:3-phosphoshikimate 1-carboxyvinyltransferase